MALNYSRVDLVTQQHRQPRAAMSAPALQCPGPDWIGGVPTHGRDWVWVGWVSSNPNHAMILLGYTFGKLGTSRLKRALVALYTAIL